MEASAGRIALHGALGASGPGHGCIVLTAIGRTWAGGGGVNYARPKEQANQYGANGAPGSGLHGRHRRAGRPHYPSGSATWRGLAALAVAGKSRSRPPAAPWLEKDCSRNVRRANCCSTVGVRIGSGTAFARSRIAGRVPPCAGYGPLHDLGLRGFAAEACLTASMPFAIHRARPTTCSRWLHK